MDDLPLIGRVGGVTAMNRWILSATLIAAAELAFGAGNLAKGRPYRFSRPPNYKFCMDAGDKTQLTDGALAPSGGQLWTRKECVGWAFGQGDGIVSVTVDLGGKKSLGGFSWHYAAGSSGVGWPRTIFVYASADGRTWDCVGDLLEASTQRDGGPQVDRYNDYRAWSDTMPAEGRYVRFVVQAANYTFCDELEVYPGDPQRAGEAHHAALKVGDPENHILTFQVRDRVMRDLKLLGGGTDRGLVRLVDDMVREDVLETKTMLPLNAVHAKVWALNSRRLAAAGFDRPVFWHTNRWANLDPLAVPSAASAAERPLEVEMMRGEMRSTAICLLNPTAQALDCVVTVEGLPETANVQCREVVFTDTRDRIPISGALLPGEGGRLRLALPAGASRQVWIAFEKPTAMAGSYEGTVKAEIPSAGTLSCPLRLRIAALDFPARPRLHVYGWDYTLTERQLPDTDAFRASHVAQMRALGMDIPWEVFRTLPQNVRFAADGTLENAAELDFSRFDRWLAFFPDAAFYSVFLAFESRKNKDGEFVFFGEKIGTPRFRRMAGGYFRAVADRMIAQGRREDQLMICFVDEPGEWKQDWRRLGDLVNDLSVALRATCPEVVLFQDPTYKDISVAPKAYWETSDVYCPPAKTLSGDDGRAEFYRSLRNAGKTLFTYSCSGPSRTLDPISYYRGISYVAFRNGAKGIGFWVFGHPPGRGCDSWHAYSQTGLEFSPYFVSAEGTTPTKQTEGIREGVEDYEYLSLLADRIRAGKTAGRDVSALKALVRDGVRRVLAGCRDKSWLADNDRDAMDELRLRILRELASPPNQKIPKL